jgi:DNA primase large subunit
MIDKAFALQEAARKSAFAPSVKLSALIIRDGYQNMTQQEMEKALMELVSEAVVVSSYHTTMVLLDEEDQNTLAETIDELTEMGTN